MLKERASGFTLIELLVVTSVITLLIGILLPALGGARESSRKAYCGVNLREIGQAINSYGNMETGLPLQPPPYKSSQFGKWTNPPVAAGSDDGTNPLTDLYTNTGVVTPVFPENAQPMANLWLLVLEKMVMPKQFVCPSDPNSPVPADIQYYPPMYASSGTFLNFGTIGGLIGAGDTFSYSFIYPWKAVGLSGPIAAWRPNVKSGIVWAADIGPSRSLPNDDPTAAPGTTLSNSKNHAGRGQNVLFADSHVEFSGRNDVGIKSDNIYTGDGGNLFVLTGGKALNSTARLNADGDDVILVPARP